LREKIRKHVQTLAGTIGERHLGRPEALARAAAYIREQLGGTGDENIEREQRGSTHDVLVIGAHYDTVPGTPGANDNGSGVAALLALAEAMRDDTPRLTIRWVAFLNEEPPYFQTERMGSYIYAEACRKRADNIAGMLSLETIGYYSDQPSSQTYPFPAQGYPDRGNFLGFVSDYSSESLLTRAADAFRRGCDIPAETLAAPATIPGISWSDHWSFWQFGYPAIMVTDTAPWRYPHYHRATDTPDKLDYVRLAEAAKGLLHAIRTIAF
jgi:Zn-dependent M28 family amino/carboxypeptidase